MKIVLFTGGARSGKSRAAVERARTLGGEEVTFLATGRRTDPEMARRIDRHREERPEGWQTVEVTDDPARALERARHPVVVLDCLTFLVAGVVSDALVDPAGDGSGTVDPADEERVLERVEGVVDALLSAAGRRRGLLLVVTNEVGSGVVPASPAGRLFRDAQGRANQRVAEEAEEVVLYVVGLPVKVR